MIKTARELCVEYYGSVDNFLQCLFGEVFDLPLTGEKVEKRCIMCDSRDLVLRHGETYCDACGADNT